MVRKSGGGILSHVNGLPGPKPIAEYGACSFMSSRKHVVSPGSSIGMLGGGQLGRMFAIAARQCGYRIHIFGDPQDSPAGQVSERSWPLPFTDHDVLRQFAQHVDVVTYEQENIPVAAVEKALNIIYISLFFCGINRLINN